MKVQDLLTDEGKWIQKSIARDAQGNRTYFDASDAVCWCLVGALHKCYLNARAQEICGQIFDKLQLAPAEWNDAPERTFADVRRLIEELDI